MFTTLNPEDVKSIFRRNVGIILQDHTVLEPRPQHISNYLIWIAFLFIVS
jgi:hypothetical protein